MSAPALPAPWLRRLVRRLARALGSIHRGGAGLGTTLALLAALSGPLHPLLDSLNSSPATAHDPELCVVVLQGPDPTASAIGPGATGVATARPGDTNGSTGHAHCALSCGLGQAAALPVTVPDLPTLSTPQDEPPLVQSASWISPIRQHAQARAPPALS
jgi:hypothetical protein